MYNRSLTIWNETYAQAYALVQALYKSETKVRPELIKKFYNYNAGILTEVQKILIQERDRANEKIAEVIEKTMLIQSDPKLNNGTMCKEKAYLELKKDLIRKKNNNRNIKNTDLNPAEIIYAKFVDQYEKAHLQKKLIKEIAKTILEEIGNLSIDLNNKEEQSCLKSNALI